jgi:hypothetical protein
MFLQLLPISVYHGCRPIMIILLSFIELIFLTTPDQFNRYLKCTEPLYKIQNQPIDGYKKPRKRDFF